MARKVWIRLYTASDGKKYAHYFEARSRRWRPIPAAVGKAMIASGHGKQLPTGTARFDTPPETVSPPPVSISGSGIYADGSRA